MQQPEVHPDILAAEKAGFDLSLVEDSLRYSYDKRAEQHQSALELALTLREIGARLYDEPKPASPAPLRN